jgi:hypothetical protein
MANLSVFRSNLAIDLGSSGTAEFSNAQMDRAVEKATHDLSQTIPLRVIMDVTNDWVITDEGFASSHGNAVQLGHKFIQPESENVTNSAQTVTYTRDTDYTMDYANGKITTIGSGSGGTMSDSTTHKIDYTKHKVVVNISSIASSGTLIAINRVEFMAGKVPAYTADAQVWGDYLIIGARESSNLDLEVRTQRRMADKTHIWIYYTKIHTAPTTSLHGTYPTALDEVVHKGAEAYLMDMKVGEHLYLMETDLTNVAADETAIDTALDEVDDYIKDNNANDMDSVLAALLTISGDNEFYDANAALDLTTTDITNADDTWAHQVKWLETGATGAHADSHAEDHLDQGTDLINAVNTGERAAALRNEYALTSIEASKVYEGRSRNLLAGAQARIAQARVRLEAATKKLEVAATYGEIARLYIQEASQRLAVAQNRLNMASQRLNLATIYATRAQQYRIDFRRMIVNAAKWLADFELPAAGSR